MLRHFAKPIPLVLILAFCTAIPVLMAAVRVVQFPLGTLPEDTMRLMAAPSSFLLHAVGGVLFGVLGPLQFARALRFRYGRLHRIAGRIFVLAGYGLGLSGLSLLFTVEGKATPLLDIARGIFGVALMVALTIAIRAAIKREITRHRAWMIRSYAIGMGSGTVALIMFPIYIATGEPVTGLLSDTVFVLWWALNIAFGDWIARRVSYRSSQ